MKFFKRNLISVFAIIAFAIIFITYIIFDYNNNIFLGLLGTTATLYFGAIRYKIEDDKFFKDLFNEFNNKYDEEFNDLLNELRDNADYELNVDQKNIIIDYLNLSAEEFLWRSKNRIPSDVWESWKSGIKNNLEISQVNEVYQTEILNSYGRKSFYGLPEELDK